MATKTAKPAKASKTAPQANAVTGTPEQSTATGKLHRRILVGTVVSDKMMKTRVIRVERQVKNTQYGKYTTVSKKFKAHDENNSTRTGDLVAIVESRPLSREKRWAIQSVVRAATTGLRTAE